MDALPHHLRVRVHQGGASGIRGEPGLDPDAGGGRYVLYWMRTAVRGHENPALDAALLAGRALDLPVFVYHALSERYPYASDRHHRFILEGARDVQEELGERGIGYAFHLERPGHRGPHLKTLAREAALVVTEDMPVSPLREWTVALRASVVCPVWEVDTACLAPMRQVAAKDTLRAYRFRKATQDIRREWLNGPWPGFEAGDREPFVPDLPFQPVDLQTADLGDLIAACDIDHAVGPVPHTPGGSRAGYARWDDFRADGLDRYKWDRNDALKPGVSRMSAYLHYGHVSPFRIAREAAEVGGKGGWKYLDELLVWREVAYAFCASHPDHDTVAALPNWARKTLQAHESDPREILSWETLARGRTGDRLWDAAQRSLLAHGELHNNVRMTWGKALLGWTRDAGQALGRLVDLNHRYALDGRDPASFGGILWCLGQFDRPFEPGTKITGTVRGRSTERHADRLDVTEYRRRVSLPAWKDAPSVGVVGAGLSGLMAARVLQDHGLEVTLFDKGRRPGGRANTREHDGHSFDHGAQYFTVRDPVIRRYLDAWVEDGVAAEWRASLVRVAEDGSVGEAKPGPRYVGRPGMIDVAAHLASELSVESGRRIAAVEAGEDAGEDGRRWRLVDENGAVAGRFHRVIVAVPAPQAVPLLKATPGLAQAAGSVDMAPCWAGMFVFPGPVNPGFDGAFVAGDGLSWIARDASKPGRSSEESWVVHASPAWTRARLELDREEAADELLEAFRTLLEESGAPSGGDALPDPLFRRAHRWGYALADGPVDGGCLWDGDAGIGACGDWCQGGRVEGALLSGIALAGRILGQAPAHPGHPLGEPAPPAQASLELFPG